MPTCPGCEQGVSYERLNQHLSYCDRLHGGDDTTLSRVNGLERRLDTIERRIEARLRVLESALDESTSPSRGRRRATSPVREHPQN